MEDLTLAVVAAIYGLVETVKYLIGGRKKASAGIENGHILEAISVDIRESRALSQSLFDMHNQRDEDGLYSWYVPRRWADRQDEIAKLVVEVSHSQEMMAKALENMAATLERIADRRSVERN